jgi:opacity protein-like surface antigen
MPTVHPLPSPQPGKTTHHDRFRPSLAHECVGRTLGGNYHQPRGGNRILQDSSSNANRKWIIRAQDASLGCGSSYAGLWVLPFLYLAAGPRGSLGLILVRAKLKNDECGSLLMQKLVRLCGLLLALAFPAMAQDNLPGFDIFGGYSHVRFSIKGTGVPGQITSNLNGGSGSAAFYTSNRLGFIADFGGYKFSTLNAAGISFGIGVSGTGITYLFGPRVRFGRGGITPFVQALFGGAHNSDLTTSNTTLCNGSTPPCTVARSDNAFAMTAGGGVDFKIARHFALRGQAEYLMTRFKQGGTIVGTATTGTQNNARISAGIVIH